VADGDDAFDDDDGYDDDRYDDRYDDRVDGGRADDGARPARIGLWGASASGKTTLLAALPAAVTNSELPGNDWILTGADDAASDFLARHVAELDRRVFPEATFGVQPLTWRFIRPAPRRGRLASAAGTLLRRQRGPRQIVFEIDVQDAMGSFYKNEPHDEEDNPFDQEDENDGSMLLEQPSLADNDVRDVLRHFERCDGLVYLFDPVDGRLELNYQYFARVLEQIARRAYEGVGGEPGRMRDARLPQYLAVCINKIDDPGVFREAYRGGFVRTGSSQAMLPEIPNELARDFFRALCSKPRSGSANQVMRSIDRYFHPDRVAFFATSSVGFYVGPTGYFRRRDFVNIEESVGGGIRLRGPMTPINVLEPFVWLEEQIRRNPPT